MISELIEGITLRHYRILRYAFHYVQGYSGCDNEPKIILSRAASPYRRVIFELIRFRLFEKVLA